MQLADLLVKYSAGVQPGERVMISFGELDSYPLLLSLYQCATRGLLSNCLAGEILTRPAVPSAVFYVV